MNKNQIRKLAYNQETLIWKNKSSELHVQSFNGLMRDYGEFEARLINDSGDVQQTLLDTLEAIEYLKKQKHIVSIEVDINGALSKIGGAKLCDWYRLQPIITFEIEDIKNA